MIFIPNRHGDDKPSGPPEVLLDGFNFKTIGHTIVNGLRWGPDGWLYGRHGITDTSVIGAPGTPEKDRTRMNCGIWRFHRKTHKFEVVLNGGTNSWGHDWDADGELFWINTVIGHLWHGIPGAFMPEGLLTALGEERVKHLIAYLMSNGQVALPR